MRAMPDRTQEERAVPDYSGPWPPDEVELTLDAATDVDLDAEEILDRRGNRIDRAYVDAAVDHVRRTVGRVPLRASGRRSGGGEGDQEEGLGGGLRGAAGGFDGHA
ncbi:hypothetical protein Sme01_06500 [Sphaerisporangium melleum]|uniref:Uncharacterized protein n=1 Tax=Sphaerisporangium melleum TaxID=321316 RepID=A0A917RM00_9ACTN|nr:hypothetical protein GCM10007964_65350 [Sphaerisporangium melleum]GII68174.1 hypothetical protein Sme01_06500 [Sphaerisporangium melleum]